MLRTPKNLGGLGIRDMHLTNSGLLGKLVWTLLHERDKLWVQVLTHKYIQHSLWRSTNRRSSSLIWRSIVKAIEALREGFKMRINAGDSSFWYSDWTAWDHYVRWGTLSIFQTLNTALIKCGTMAPGTLVVWPLACLRRLKR